MTQTKGIYLSAQDAINISSGEYFKLLSAEFSDSCTLDDFKRRILRVVTALGFTDYVFMRMDRSWHDHSQKGLLYSLPEEFMRLYHQDNFYLHDLMISYGEINTQSIFSSQVYGYFYEAPFNIELTRKNRELYQLNQRFKYYEHYAVPIRASNGSGNVQLILMARDMEKEVFQSMAKPVMPVCRHLCKAIDKVSTKKFRTSFINIQDNPVGITPKLLRILNRFGF